MSMFYRWLHLHVLDRRKAQAHVFIERRASRQGRTTPDEATARLDSALKDFGDTLKVMIPKDTNGQ